MMNDVNDFKFVISFDSYYHHSDWKVIFWIIFLSWLAILICIPYGLITGRALSAEIPILSFGSITLLMIIFWPFRKYTLIMTIDSLIIKSWKKLVVFSTHEIPLKDIKYVSIREYEIIVETNVKRHIIRYNNKSDINSLITHFKNNHISISNNVES